jgi:hypothetical protein
MVDFGHRWADGECDSKPCPWCEFKSSLMDEISSARDKPEHVWNKVVGDLQDRLYDAVWALHRVRREGFTTEHDLIANEQEAAERLVSVFHALDGFRCQFGIDLHDEEDA